MANFAGFDRDMNASLESTFFPQTERCQTGENQSLQNRELEHLSQDSDSEDEIIIQIDQASVNTHDLANEYFEAQLIVDNNRSNDDENENEGQNLRTQTQMQFSWMRRCDLDVIVNLKIVTEALTPTF